jgi:hypothetical protein
MANQKLVTAYPAPRARSRWTPRAYISYLKGVRVCACLSHGDKAFERLAVDSWQIAPGTTSIASAAYSLPGQLSRITGMAYTTDPGRDMRGGFEVRHAPTRAFLLRNVYLIDGALYAGRYRIDLHPRNQIARMKRYFPTTSISLELDRGALYSSFEGNEFFGIWLTEDCSTYPLAAAAGVPVTSNQPVFKHTSEYEALFDMTPVRTNAAFLREAVFFVDGWSNNTSQHQRFAALRTTLLTRYPRPAHPGVFILRGNSGTARTLKNELQIAEHLRKTRGFSVVDPTGDSVAKILAQCAGAKVLVGVEGSQLIHGLMVLQPGASVLTLQPPDRFCSVIKKTTDMAGQHYGYVVGKPAGDGFTADVQEIERTLDLLPSASIVPAIRREHF